MGWEFYKYVIMLEHLGLNKKISEMIEPIHSEGFQLARVIVEHRERYIIQNSEGVYTAEITGNLRYSAQKRSDYPAVGDWVKVMPMDSDSFIIMEILPRFSVLERKAVSEAADTQLIATNIDEAFIVQSVGLDFNINRLQRYLSICNSSGIRPHILLSKTDLVSKSESAQLIRQINEQIKDVLVIPSSIKHPNLLAPIEQHLKPYKTYCFLGSSGVGKSTIINHLNGNQDLKTDTISESTNKGKHTTTRRELFILDNGSIVIDTPGMREVGMTESRSGIDSTFDYIVELTNSCKFNDCTHIQETGCAVLEAVEKGDISNASYENYLKLLREQERFTSTIQEKRQKSRAQGKMYKAIINEKKKNR